MRPVEKGVRSRDYANYADALPDLRGRIGPYCSYCERRFETHLAVEHVLPKSPRGEVIAERLLDWENFLLACVNCNSCKGSEEIDMSDCLWPDRDNTFMALVYTRGLVGVNESLDMDVQEKAERLIRLVGLDIDPGNEDPKRQPSHSGRMRDNRFNRRFEVWKDAERNLRLLEENDTDTVRHLIAEKAAATGLFSIWMSVFQEDADMRWRFIDAFAGTASSCFDHDAEPVHRPGGVC